MTFKIEKVIASCFLATLAACSAGQQSAEFTLEGVEPRASVCPINPLTFASAIAIPDINEGNGCGVTHAYKINAIAGVQFDNGATINCETADTLNQWINTSVQPAAQAVYGQRVVSMTVAASYSCRPRDNVSGAKLSEHGLGDAIDFSEFTLENGHSINVERDYYGAANDQQFLRRIRKEACGPFHTVLGPGSDSYHKNHIHLDLQPNRRGGGPYCH